MGFLGKLWRGEYPLHITFWRLGLGVFLVYSLVVPIIGMRLEIGDSNEFILAHITFFYSWSFLWMVSTWKSATRYSGNSFWKYAAKTVVLFLILSLLLVVFSEM